MAEFKASEMPYCCLCEAEGVEVSATVMRDYEIGISHLGQLYTSNLTVWIALCDLHRIDGAFEAGMEKVKLA